MGVLRLLLALCVFCTHSRMVGGLHWLDGYLAVEFFFVVSGFYMQLVLDDKYTEDKLGKAWRRQFYKARYFRLLPIYLSGVLIVLGVALLAPDFVLLPTWKSIAALPDTLGNLLFKAFLCLTNLTIVFQDVTMFFAVHDGRVRWTPNFWNSDINLWQGLVIPPAWSLGIELSFYLIAPYLLNWRARWLVVGVLSAFTAKMIVTKMLHGGDPWHYRFFPFELGYFLLGALAFRYRGLSDSLLPDRIGKYCVYPLVIGLTVFNLHPHNETIVYPVALACFLPFIFKATSAIKADRLIGEFSYPFYIFHYVAIAVAGNVVAHWLHSPTDSIAWIGLGLTLVISAIALALEYRFIEPWRARFAERPRELKVDAIEQPA